MKISSDKRINEFLLDIESLSPEKFEMMILIRDLFFKENKDLVEDIKYGGLVFNLSDNLVGGLFVYKQHISIEFSNGADFDDNGNILEGGGKQRRHIKISSKGDINQKNSSYFIKQALCNRRK